METHRFFRDHNAVTEPKEPTTDVLPVTALAVLHAIRRIQWFTVAWMIIEAVVALTTAVHSHSVALAAFGADSAIELFSAATVLWRFRSTHRGAEATASKITGCLLVALALFIVCQSVYTLLGGRPEPRASYLGIVLLVAAAFVMPRLGRRKRQLAAISKSISLTADAAQSSVCAYMSWIALGGLLLNAVAHTPWADPLAAIGLLPLVIREAKEALAGPSCCDS